MKFLDENGKRILGKKKKKEKQLEMRRGGKRCWNEYELKSTGFE